MRAAGSDPIAQLPGVYLHVPADAEGWQRSACHQVINCFRADAELRRGFGNAQR